MKKLVQMLVSMNKIGLIGFGGGNALIPVIQQEVVEEKGFITGEEYEKDIVAGGRTDSGSTSGRDCSRRRKSGFREKRNDPCGNRDGISRRPDDGTYDGRHGRIESESADPDSVCIDWDHRLYHVPFNGIYSQCLSGLCGKKAPWKGNWRVRRCIYTDRRTQSVSYFSD